MSGLTRPESEWTVVKYGTSKTRFVRKNVKELECLKELRDKETGLTGKTLRNVPIQD